MKVFKVFLVVLLAGLFAGCSMSGGSAGGSANYAFPNSNVTPIKSVTQSSTKMMFGVPSITNEDLQDLLGKALEQVPEADLIVDYTLDSNTNMILPFVYKVSLDLHGTAAKMEVGRQDLEHAEKLGYN